MREKKKSERKAPRETSFRASSRAREGRKSNNAIKEAEPDTNCKRLRGSRPENRRKAATTLGGHWGLCLPPYHCQGKRRSPRWGGGGTTPWIGTKKGRSREDGKQGGGQMRLSGEAQQPNSIDVWA